MIFRRTSPQITNKGSLWEKSLAMYTQFGGIPRQTDLSWHFPLWGSDIRFSHLEHEGTVYNHQGSEIPLIEFDELTHFHESQFWYMLSRNRSTLGFPGYVRATTNPDADSWVAKLLDWWIADDGYANPERAGKIRYFARVNDEIVWGDSREALHNRGIDRVAIKSFSFIPANVFDNPVLMAADPTYLANLRSLSYVEQMRLLGGNWKVRAEAGTVFHRDWFKLVDQVPHGGVTCRYWDFAATEKKIKKPDPDYSAGVLVRRTGRVFTVLDVIAVQAGPSEVERLFYETARLDRKRCISEGSRYLLQWEQEPGSAGKRETYRMASALPGYDAAGIPSRGEKLIRARPLAAQVKLGNVQVIRAPWTEGFLTHMHNQPQFDHDDIMDAASGSYNALVVDLENDQQQIEQQYGTRSYTTYN